MLLPWRQPIDPEGVARRALSTSFVSALADPERGRLLDDIRATARRHPQPLSLAYVTEMTCYRRVD